MSSEPKKSTTRIEDDAPPLAERSGSPIWLIALLALLGYGGMLYLNSRAGGFSPKVYGPYESLASVDAAQPRSGDEELFAKGRLIFNAACASCHQATGLGVPGQYPPLAGSEWVLAKEPGRVIRIVLNGLQGPVQVKGQPFGNVAMPAWKGVYTDDKDIAAVLTFIRGNKEWGNDAPAVKPDRVKAVREKLVDRGDPFTADEVSKVSETE